MACRMEAGQQEKRLRSSSQLVQSKGKKKIKMYSSDYVLNLRSHVCLEWDDTGKMVVARKGQVGITWSNMAPFVDSIPHSPFGVADVLTVPQEIFGLENLTEVLSYEVWATCLSESERKLLTQFLPCGTSAEQVLHSLLKGENHHFGNPYLKWSASLCSGDLHPDAVHRVERQRRANKKAYYSDRDKYHRGMIEVLKKWKQRWITCKDPEKFLSEGFIKNKQGRLPLSAKRAKAAPVSKKDKANKNWISRGDVAKHYSCIKVTKKQIELVKNMKGSGKGIQFKSLSRVLGNISSFYVRRHENSEEEENNRLTNHWLQLATKDLPVFFEKYKDEKMKKERVMRSLVEELAEKKKFIMNKVFLLPILRKSPRPYHQEHEDDGYSGHPISEVLDQGAVDSASNFTHGHHDDWITSLSSHQEVTSMVLDLKPPVFHDILKSTDSSPNLLQYFSRPDPAAHAVEPNPSISSAEAMWQALTVRDSHYQNTSDSFRSMMPGCLSLSLPQLTEKLPAHMNHLERNMPTPSALHIDNRLSLPFPYLNQDHNELLPHLPRMIRPKPPEQQFVMTNDSLLVSDHFGHQFQEFVHQVDNRDVYSNGIRPNPGNFLSAAHQGPANGGLVGRNWFLDDNRASNGWSGGHCFSNGGNADESLYSVLPRFGNPQYSSPYDVTRSQQFMQAGNYNVARTPNNGGLHANYATDQFRNPSSLDAATDPSLTSANPTIDFFLRDPTRSTYPRTQNV